MANSGESIQLKLLTLNCWGLKFVSAHRQERIHAIADFLANSSNTHSRSCSTNSLEPFSDHHHRSPSSSNTAKTLIAGSEIPAHKSTEVINSSSSFRSNPKSFDIVALQELWVYHDFLVIRDRAKEGGFKYSKWFHSAALGSGLAILSRFPIISSHFHPYLLNGHPLHFIQGDFFVGKSVGSCLLDVPMIGEVEVFTTHLYAPHDVPAPEWKRAHRTAQAWELGKLVNASAERGRTVFVCGDLNSVPTSLPITLLQSHGQLRDSWTTSHVDGQTTHTTNESSFRTAVEEEGMTCDSMINTFTASKNAANRGAKGYGKRLDYILYRPAAKRVSGRDPLQSNRSHTHFIDDQIIRCDFSKVILTEPIPVFGFSYSDHFAVEASFTVYPTQPSSGVDSDEPIDQRATQESNQTDIRPPSLTCEQINNCISALMIKYRSSERSSQIQLSLFIICIILVPGISIAASFQPLKYLNWIFTLLSCGVGGLGMTMLYSGFLAGNWERSAIQEICDQLEFQLNLTLQNQNQNHHLSL
ncbi:hypothetical protein Pst134EA_015661 [Puccinia striiformis f. sp. tritici]|uniref:uncharacterized protein n=1 Tax=Puccinia striiformis f. sp. tritici TaxID=168172 RepID=UPI002008BE27|nr:uncharacterized protein Pst134EA_031265 [Puccinia striiformis f. sp. tritici]XP_047805409.1 hypothetical protein Pst134EA_015661 [Puccinia striiformis f. sp. tritici]KAH9443430.1 hypothetical protein Pst134EA_031265 [Puccinia striiformis f. sp. tritici]KAH9463573.1 hypothetical protein Pst134EA_015661 [Puccinia striiformis f. sp. tritici]